MHRKCKILYVLGTRPEAIKLIPLIERSKRDARFETRVCSTDQHREMLQSLFSLFKVTPDYSLNVMQSGQSLRDVTTRVLSGVGEILRTERPDLVVVQGDTTTGFAAGLAAFYDKIKVIHIEAGLRSGDMTSPFPEEFNRRTLSLLADVHMAPTETARLNLVEEGIELHKTFVTGNTGIDALLSARQKIEDSTELKAQFEHDFSFLNRSRRLLLATLHRRESFGAPMEQSMRGLLKLSQRSDVEILLPLHLNPNVRECAARILGDHAQWVQRGQTAQDSRIWLCDPLDYLSFVYLMNRSYFLIRDSGGVQEEAPSLGKPVLIARENTERPEAIQAGTSRLIPLEEAAFAASAAELLDNDEVYRRMARAQNPFGDGTACVQILDILANRYVAPTPLVGERMMALVSDP